MIKSITLTWADTFSTGKTETIAVGQVHKKTKDYPEVHSAFL